MHVYTLCTVHNAMFQYTLLHFTIYNAAGIVVMKELVGRISPSLLHPL